MVLDPDDPDTRSAGSFFINPVLDLERFAALERAARAVVGPGPGVPRYPAGDGGVKVPAAWLIEQAGFRKGYPHRGRVSPPAGAPASPPSTRWPWSTRAGPPPPACWHWPGRSGRACGRRSGWNWPASRFWSVPASERRSRVPGRHRTFPAAARLFPAATALFPAATALFPAAAGLLSGRTALSGHSTGNIGIGAPVFRPEKMARTCGAVTFFSRRSCAPPRAVRRCPQKYPGGAAGSTAGVAGSTGIPAGPTGL